MCLSIHTSAQPSWPRNDYKGWGASDAAANDDQNRIAWSAYGREKRAKEEALNEAKNANEKLKDILHEKEKAENARWKSGELRFVPEVIDVDAEEITTGVRAWLSDRRGPKHTAYA